MLENPLFVDRHREQIGDLAAAEQRAVQDHARREDQHQKQGEEEGIENDLHDLLVNPQRKRLLHEIEALPHQVEQAEPQSRLKTITSA